MRIQGKDSLVRKSSQPQRSAAEAVPVSAPVESPPIPQGAVGGPPGVSTGVPTGAPSGAASTSAPTVSPSPVTSPEAGTDSEAGKGKQSVCFDILFHTRPFFQPSITVTLS